MKKSFKIIVNNLKKYLKYNLFVNNKFLFVFSLIFFTLLLFIVIFANSNLYL